MSSLLLKKIYLILKVGKIGLRCEPEILLFQLENYHVNISRHLKDIWATPDSNS